MYNNPIETNNGYRNMTMTYKQIAKNYKYAAVMHAYGEAYVLSFETYKREAVLAIQIQEGTDARPNSSGDMGEHKVMKISHFLNQYPELAKQPARL